MPFLDRFRGNRDPDRDAGAAAAGTAILDAGQKLQDQASRPSRWPKSGENRGDVPPPEAPPAAAAVGEDNDFQSLPILVSIDFQRGLSRISDAEAFARAFIEKNFDAPSASFFHIMPWRDGIAFEMQMGGGFAYLPHVLAEIDADPDAVVAVPMSNRVMTVRFDQETERLECLILSAGQMPPEDAVVVRASRKMQPFDRRGNTTFLVGASVFVMSVIATLFSLAQFFFDPAAWSGKDIPMTQSADLPLVRSAMLAGALRQGDCVARFEYAAGAWKVTPGYDNGGVCSLEKPAAGPVPVLFDPPGAGSLPGNGGSLPLSPADGQPAGAVPAPPVPVMPPPVVPLPPASGSAGPGPAPAPAPSGVTADAPAAVAPASWSPVPAPAGPASEAGAGDSGMRTSGTMVLEIAR